MKLSNSSKKLKAFSIMEIILAVGIYSVVMLTGMVVVLNVMNINKSTLDKNRARLLSTEGIEATKSIKDHLWSDIVAGEYMIQKQSDSWVLAPYTFDPDQKFNRKIIIQDLYRDLSGELFTESSNGVLDPNIKKIVVEVIWQVNTKNFSQIDELYLANWERNFQSIGTGMVVYAVGDTGTPSMKYKTMMLGDRWSDENTVPNYYIPQDYSINRVELIGSSSDDTKMLITKQVSTTSRIVANFWDGEDWQPSSTITEFNSPSYPLTRDFDGAYYGDNFMLVYNDSTSTPKYRIWDGSSWSSVNSFPSSMGSQPVWIVLKNLHQSNELIAVFRTSNLRTYTLRWNGSSWTNSTQHASSSTSANYENIDFDYNFSTQRGGLMFNENNDNSPNIRIYTYSNSWSSNVENQNIGVRANIFNIASHPTESTLIGCTIGASYIITCSLSGYAPSWISPMIITNSTYNSGYLSFDISFEKLNGNQAVIVYSGGTDKNIPKYRYFDNASQGWGAEETLPQLGSGDEYELKSVRAIPQDNSDQIMFVMGAEQGIVSTVIWNGSLNSFYDSGDKGFTVISDQGPQSSFYWYDFDWNSN